MEKLKKHLKWIIATGVFIVITGVILFFFLVQEQPDPPFSNAQIPEPISADKSDDKETKEKKNEKISIMVDVQGSVERPGVYQMKEGDRVIHAIQKAGGFLSDAEVRSVNQAQKISDEMIIYVAKKGENYSSETPSSVQEETKININTADASKLQELSGVGPSKAESILSYREENGPFTSIDQLLDVRGIGEKTIEEWKDKIELQ
ncbi:ComEA family DNA-binding protein [Fictibacillus barbaricus]|uniref:Competence protein ComEA n=1 Tax=Fictibacillus barbaricus TaxID=182136 RepID=A0ABU1U072_9BACL|nr:ComEA family DNA-binding protein [Fictibacillus barbaricus]MDR7072816.1 competence protein ComEA [Fictibacillus barbaricus]